MGKHKNIYCEECHKSIRSDNFKRHINSRFCMTNNEKLFKTACSIEGCLHPTDKTNLRRHIKKYHPEIAKVSVKEIRNNSATKTIETELKSSIFENRKSMKVLQELNPEKEGTLYELIHSRKQKKKKLGIKEIQEPLVIHFKPLENQTLLKNESSIKRLAKRSICSLGSKERKSMKMKSFLKSREIFEKRQNIDEEKRKKSKYQKKRNKCSRFEIDKYY